MFSSFEISLNLSHVNIIERFLNFICSIFRLLTEDPNERLGAKGAAEVPSFPVLNR